MSVGVVLAILWTGLVVGWGARFAIPGPDPMPIWLTLIFGLIGAIAGAVVADTAGANGYVVTAVAFVVAIAVVALYRVVVQKRPVFGPGARKFPERGIGVEMYRDRLRKAGFDPDSLRPDPKTVRDVRLHAAIDELHREGVLDDEELKTLQDRLTPPAG